MTRRIAASLLTLCVVAAAVLLGAMAPSQAATVRYSHTWRPPLNLSSSYQACCRTKARYAVLPTTLKVGAARQASLRVVLQTSWVDVKAVADSPNVIQQGLYADGAQFKIQIRHGTNPAAHVAQCRVQGATGSVMAKGPRIDVADGRWHDVTCVKSPDSATGTDVVVVVDGVAGPVAHSSSPIGAVATHGPVDLGGRSATASSDSLDGRVSLVSYTVA